ncbi:ribonuclease H-like protein [Marasmius fiardii PR-910]|nr:ribonuclease H-like protein [Marasmius fiardii PR-910]
MTIEYITHPRQAEHVLSSLIIPNSHIGIDIEWKPNYTKNTPENPVALIQIATSPSDVYLFHISRLSYFPQKLAFILINPFITKSGVGIQYDLNKLWLDCGISVSSAVDLSLLARSIDSTLFAHRLGTYSDLPLYPHSLHPTPYDPYEHRLFRGQFKSPIGLARFARLFQGIELDKGKTARSNWEAPLSHRQISYAAADATTSYSTYFSLLNLITPIPPDLCPKRKYFMFDSIRGANYLPIRPEERLSILPPTPHTPFDEQEAVMYLHGLATVQHPNGLLPWVLHNPEYDPAPMPVVPKEKKDTARRNSPS